VKNSILIKKAISSILFHSGILKRLLQRERNGIILGYHQVIPDGDERLRFLEPGMFVTTSTLEKHLQFLKGRYSIIRLEELPDIEQTGRLCCLTFDDGWEDNYTHAFPILQKYDVPATIFVTTGNIGDAQWPWPYRISYYLHSSDMMTFLEIVGSGFFKIGLRSAMNGIHSVGKGLAVHMLLTRMKQLDNSLLETLMEFIDNAMSDKKIVLDRKRPMLTWEEISEMGGKGITFGAHTHTHKILTSIPISEADDEISRSKKILMERTGKPVDTFCYPNGSFNHDIVKAVDRQGFRIAVTTKKGFMEDSENRLEMRRIMIHNDMTSTIPMFSSVISCRVPFF